MTTPAIRPFALLACLALLACVASPWTEAAEQKLTPIERAHAATKSLGRLASDGPRRHLVAKPAYPVWEDAARLVDDGRADSPTAQRRTVYQNPPDPLNLRGLTEGVREGTRPLTEAGQRAGDWIESQARGVAEGTRRMVDQTGENLRSGARDALNGTASTLQRALPGSTGPYAERTQYDASEYDYNQQSTPTRADDNQFATPAPDYREDQLRNAQIRADQQRRDEQERLRRQQQADAIAADQRAYERQLDREPSRRTNNGFVERFAEDNDRLAESRAPLPPVRRTETNRVANDQDTWRAFDDSSNADTYPPLTSRDFGSDTPGFPELNPPRNDWDAGFARGQSPNTTPGVGQLPYAPAYNPGGTAQPNQGGTNPVNNSTNPTAWTGQAGSQQSAGTNTAGGFVGANTAGEVAVRENSTNLDRLLLVILGAASCFTWLAYYDVRQKYRLALRGVQVSDFGSQSAAA